MHAFVFCFLLLCSHSIASLAEASKTLSGFSINLIHRDSPLSPFYKPSLTPSDRIINTALRSIYQLNRASHSDLNEKKTLERVRIPNHGEYLMRFYIGTPPVERLAIADTASDLIWVQCSPCETCFPQDTPLFEPHKSSTFANLSCDSQPCTSSNIYYCPLVGNLCLYTNTYGDGSSTKGVLCTESIHFGSQTVTFPKTIFGCGSNNDFMHQISNKVTGIVGLGAGPLSLVSQLGDQIGHKFSYCLLPFTSTSTIKLKFGNDTTITGNGVVSTPLIIDPHYPSYYFLHLVGITIGQKMLQVRTTDHTNGNIIIDLGTVLTYLEVNFYHNFVTLLREALGISETKDDIPYPFDFCFPNQANITFPKIVFQFTGAKVFLSPKNLFFRFDDLNMICLAVLPDFYAKGFSVFGNLAQVDFQVEYDRKGKKVSFAPADCSKN